jgi:myo-inositol catabolism protein IolC
MHRAVLGPELVQDFAVASAWLDIHFHLLGAEILSITLPSGFTSRLIDWRQEAVIRLFLFFFLKWSFFRHLPRKCGERV